MATFTLVSQLQACGSAPLLKPWHTETLTEEYTSVKGEDAVRTLDDYLALEDRL